MDQFNQTAENLLGPGRFNGLDDHPVVPRNAPTIFNIALYDRHLFWDGRVERLRNGGIATPDSQTSPRGRRLADSALPSSASLVDAQARFPVTSVEEMRGQFMPTASNQALRTALNERMRSDLAEIPSNWPSEFANVFGSDEITTDRVYSAIAEYQRSMLFVASPWQQYLTGQDTALSDTQKRGAILFFTPSQRGGAGCVMCHNGPTFSDERHHLVAFPQIGIGKGNVTAQSDQQDFGRENITGRQEDRYHFRTPSLLNVATTAPYGHSGAYQTLEQVIEHYNDPRAAIDRLFGASNEQAFSEPTPPYCQLPQILSLSAKHNLACESVFPNAYANSIEVANHLTAATNNSVTARAPLRARPNLTPQQVTMVADFLRSLTDPCVNQASCLSPWLLSEEEQAEFPDDLAISATDNQGSSL